MNWTSNHLWLIPVLPLLAAGVLSVTPRAQRRLGATLTIGAMAMSFVLSLAAFLPTLGRAGTGQWHEVHNFDWFNFGDTTLRLGWVLDPLSGVMLVMVSFVSLLIFIYSVGYMAHDDNFTRFFCFLSLFGAAMLGLVIANSLLLLFMCWELVGLASYLLIGFWYHKPSAAAAAKKAFITTRIGDVVFFLGMLMLYSHMGTLLFYDRGAGCLDAEMLIQITGRTTFAGIAVTTAIGLLIYCGAIGKSGQLPLHVWLPDAMEGPTPVSALIHAATMVAAGVFLTARIYPLLNPAGFEATAKGAVAVVAWVGAITAVFAACIAVAQTDIKRILAYSTISQLGFMMLGLGVGGVAVGMFHLITHAFFKALLFLGAGSVIHGCHEEQDIRKMGGLQRRMPITFATYGIGMMALAGVPLFFSGFWSKDEILHAAHRWHGPKTPFYLGMFGALLTAFYMTRQMCYVFRGESRGNGASHAHESPRVMTVPLTILAVFAVILGFIGTPAWPWFQSYLEGKPAFFSPTRLFDFSSLSMILTSTVLVTTGVGLGWWFYARKPIESASEPDPLEELRPDVFAVLRNKFYVDEFYEATVIRFNAWWAGFCDNLDYWVWNGAVLAVGYAVVGLSWASRFFDEYVVNLLFDHGCESARGGGTFFSRLQNGQVQAYLRVIGVALAVLGLVLMWGWVAS